VQIALIAAAFGILTGAAILADAVFSRARWRRAPLRLERRLPQAFAVGAPVTIQLGLDNPGELPYAGELFDAADPSLEMPGMPLAFAVGARQRQLLEFRLLPTRRGLKRFEPAQIRLHSRLGLIDWRLRVGDTEERRVYPNFAQQAQLAWLVSDQRLGALGLAPVRRRGTGTDFDQLVEYRPGDPVRHIDWKATQKHQRPIVRRFQDERDQSVLFLLDCGRRMRADDSEQGIGATHFDQCLNAVMLLAFVALGAGDAVGAMTFGTPPGAEQSFAPRKGRRTLNALMAGLSDVEPTATFSDYERAAADLFRRQRKRALLVLITNCRNEDAANLGAALKLLRTRHLVVLANLREQIVGQIADQPLRSPDSALEAAAALAYAQQRLDMLRRFAQGGVLMIDCEPKRLGVELVRRYTILKGAGAL
jgi:uncharacterized protein (DUF58 family)